MRTLRWQPIFNAFRKFEFEERLAHREAATRLDCFLKDRGKVEGGLEATSTRFATSIPSLSPFSPRTVDAGRKLSLAECVVGPQLGTLLIALLTKTSTWQTRRQTSFILNREKKKPTDTNLSLHPLDLHGNEILAPCARHETQVKPAKNLFGLQPLHSPHFSIPA